MRDLISKIQRELAEGRSLCRATIVTQLGSAPRSLGTSFLVLQSGAIWGTIGGGLLEAEVVKAAGQALAQGRSELLDFHLTGADAAQSDMICGGRVQVYLEPLRPSDEQARVFWEMAGQAASSATQTSGALMGTWLKPGPAPDQAGRKLLWRAGRLLWPQEPQDLALVPRQLLKDIEVMPTRTGACLWSAPPEASERDFYFLELIINQPVVYICGGGHISLCLAPLVKMAGFGSVVIDDRPEFADGGRFTMADRVLVRDFRGIFQGLALNAQSYLVIVTRGHLHDKDVLAQALTQPVAYVGMIGSRRKRQLIYQALEEEGFAPERLAAVHSPIGLPIGAETPEEIAISIVAQLIAVRAALSNGTAQPFDRS